MKFTFANLDLLSAGEGERLNRCAERAREPVSCVFSLSGRASRRSARSRQSRGLKIGYVSQYVPEQLFGRTFYDLVLDESRRRSDDYKSWRADIVLDDHALPVRQLPVRQLSGGWQQLALLAHAWVSEPDVLSPRRADQPSGSKNWLTAGRLAECCRRSVAVVVSSHDRAPFWMQ